MKGAPLVLFAWAALLAVHTTVLIALGGDELEVGLLGGASAGAFLVGLFILVRRRRRRAGTGPPPDLSLPAALAAVAVAGLVLGAELGTPLMAVSAGLLALAAAGLLRERRPRAGDGDR